MSNQAIYPLSPLSITDIVISFASVALLAMFFIVAMACHHRCPRRYTCLIKDFLALAEGQASTWASLFHHGIVLACSGICGLVMAAGGILSAEASFNCVDSIVYILTVMISQMYLYLVTNVPELIFVTFFIALENSLMASQEKFKKNGDIKKLCRQLVHLYDTLRHLEDIFGPSIMTSFGFLTLILTCVIYFSFLSLSSTLGFNKAALNTWLCAHIIYAFLTIKRLLHITNHAHRFYRQVDNAVVELIKVDVDHPDKALASQAKDLLQRVDGMPILGFFTLKRGILLAILSNLLTYLIILIEFKMDSL